MVYCYVQVYYGHPFQQLDLCTHCLSVGAALKVLQISTQTFCDKKKKVCWKIAHLILITLKLSQIILNVDFFWFHALLFGISPSRLNNGHVQPLAQNAKPYLQIVMAGLSHILTQTSHKMV